jgi:hypothetical protein
MASSKQAIALRSMSSWTPLPLCMRTTDVSVAHSRVNVSGPPSASAQ